MKINKLIYNFNLTRIILAQFINDNEINSEEEARKLLSEFSPKPVGTSNATNRVHNSIYDLKIIIPAYNVEHYIEECLSSIISQQTQYTFVIVVINDGSTDNTREILEKYENNPIIRIIDQPNRGLSGARNRGLQVIESKYLMFVDSDDKLESNSIQALLACAFSNDSDIVEGSFYFFSQNKILAKIIHKDNLIVDTVRDLRGYAWGKVIKSSLFANIKFPEGFWYEDSIFSYLIYPQSKKSSTIHDIVYWYRSNSKGICKTSKHNKKSIDTYWILEQMLEDMESSKICLTQEIYELLLHQIHLNFNRTKYMPEKVRQSIFVLSSDIFQIKFLNYKTQNSKYKELEEALKKGDYRKYFLLCTML